MTTRQALEGLVEALAFVHENVKKLECINISLAMAYSNAKKKLEEPMRNFERFSGEGVILHNRAVNAWANETNCSVDFGRWLTKVVKKKKTEGAGK